MVRGAAEQAGSMEEFKQGSDEIENIIRTIDNIAFQTNILVLNTAVEATINRITLCFCPAGDCVLAGLPCQLVELHQFLPPPSGSDSAVSVRMGITNPVPITFPWPGHPPVWPGRTSGLMLRWNLCGQQRIDQAVPLPEVGEFQGLHITQPLDVLNKAFLFL